MKICYIIDEYFPPEKGYTALFYYIRHLSRLGYDITVISGRKGGEPKTESMDGIKVCRTSFKYRYGHRFDSILFSLFVFRCLMKRKYDIIHLCYFSTSFLVNLFLKLIKNGSKVICDIRTIPPRRWVMGKQLRKFACWTADETIVLDDAIASKIFSRRKNYPYFVLPLGVEFGLFCSRDINNRENIRKSIGVKNDEILLVSVGTLDASREQENLLKGFKIAFEENSNIKLLIIGDGPDRYYLENGARNIGVIGRVIFTGLVSYNRIPQYLRAADIGVTYLPIPLYDPQPPLKTVEYLAAGLPVIATNTYGNRKYIVNGYNGILINDTAEDLANAIKKMISDEGLKKKLASNAINSVTKYNYSDIVKDILIPIYAKICKE